MANQFIKDRPIEIVQFDVPTFIGSGASNQDIVKGTMSSGNSFLDMAIDKAIDYSKKLDVMKANNEKAKHSIELQKNIQEYENMWQESGDNKYSDDNYSKYISGLNEIYDTAKMNFATTKYTRENDVLQWENSIDEERNKSIYVQNGEKARFDIQAVTDETLMNVSAMSNNYIMSGNYEDLSDAIKLLDGLSDFIPKHKLDEMKRKQVMNAEKNRMNSDIERIINNPNLSVEEKRASLSRLQNDIAKNKQAYEFMGEQAVDMGLYDDINIAKSDYQAMYQDAMNANGGIINRLDEQIRNEEYNNMVKLDNYKYQVSQNIIKDTVNLKNSLKNGDDFKAISVLEGKEITGYDLLNNIQLSQKYYESTPHNILFNKDVDGKDIATNKYIPTMSLYDVNQIKNKSRVDSENMIPRNEQLLSLSENMSNLSGDEKENLKREYVANGVTTQLEIDLIDGRVTPNTMSSGEMINYANIGSKNSRVNKMMNFTGVNPKSKLGRMVQDLDYYERQQLTELVTGAVLSGRFGSAFGGKELTQGTINSQMNIVGEFMQDSIDIIKSSVKTKYKKADIKIKEDIDSIIADRYNKPLHLRLKTKEKGTKYVETGYVSLDEEF